MSAAAVTIPEQLIAATGSISIVGATVTTTSILTSTVAAIAAASASASPSAAPYTLPGDLPPTHYRILTTIGDLALYNTTLLLITEALLQHTVVFGILFFLRDFSSRRALDLHYLTIVFALSFIAAPIVFLVDLRIDQTNLLFFLDHEAVEFLIAVRVLLPAAFVAKRSGSIILVCWCSLVAVAVPVVLDEQFHHAADLVAWFAFASDFLVAVSGVMLVRKWWITRHASIFALRKARAEALAGLGFMLHGFTTMVVGPIFSLVLYNQLDPSYFAYAWAVVFLTAFFAVGFAVPVAGIFFSNIRWCISHRKAVFPGQAEWAEEYEKGYVTHSTGRLQRQELFDPPGPWDS